jgi:hypothetical protein
MAKSPQKSKTKPKKKPSPSLPIRAATKLTAAATTARKVVRTSKAAFKKARSSPAAARKALATLKERAHEAGHMAEVGAERATKAIATTAGVVAGIVDSVTHHESSIAKRPARSKPKSKRKK